MRLVKKINKMFFGPLLINRAAIHPAQYIHLASNLKGILTLYPYPKLSL